MRNLYRLTSAIRSNQGAPSKYLYVCAIPILVATISQLTTSGQFNQVQAQAQSSGRAGSNLAPGRFPASTGIEGYDLKRSYLDWPISPADHAYASIDGKKLHGYVSEITAISDRYRDNGHPQFWGRIEGTEADAESAQWVFDKLKQAGLSDVRIQQFDLPPQWMPQSWEITASSGGKVVKVETAQPAVRSVGTEGSGLDLEAVYVGLGTKADFAGRDVRGKAVIIYSMPEPGVWAQSAQYNGSIQRAEDNGAAAIFDVICLPGNVRSEFPLLRGPISAPARPGAAPLTAATLPVGKAPAFTVGFEDGEAMRQLIEAAPEGQAPHIKVRLDIKEVPGLKSSNVWGVLPGMTDEKVIIIAHRDGYFEGAGDNASGMATLIGLAEYFAKVPKDQRHRTIEFVGTTGHHGTAAGVRWMADNKETALAKTALVMNAEHTALTQQYMFAGKLRPANTTNAEHWDFNGSQRLVDIAMKAFGSFGVPTYATTDRVAMAEINPISQLVPSFGIINVDTYYHTDGETPDKVPWTGLGAVTRAFAKIINDTGNVEIKDLQKPTVADR